LVSVIAVTVITYIVTSLAVGISYFALFGQRIGVQYNRKALFVLFLIFAVLDSYWVLALTSLDVSFSLGNQEAARSFGLASPIRLNEIIGIGWFDVILWIIQTALGYFAGMKVYDRLVRRALTQRRS
jgi:hypothetical protein